MSGILGDFSVASAADAGAVAGGSGAEGVLDTTPSGSAPRDCGTPRDCRRVTVRLSGADYARLVALADGMTLSAYIRGCVFAEAGGRCDEGTRPQKRPRKRGRRSQATLADKAALAECLALLGQSRVANNLNQLAHRANIGTLLVDAATRAQIADAYAHIKEMRGLLVTALRSGAGAGASVGAESAR